MKQFSLLVSFLLIYIVATFGQQLNSPDQYLGYQLGDRYTPHHKIVSYFQQVALAKPQMMKLEQYGETNEGRPLLLAFVATMCMATKQAAAKWQWKLCLNY